jgi:hypothetical protein
LISLPTANRWLYAGTHTSGGCDWQEAHKLYYYKLEERQSCAEFNGRLIISFVRPGRNSYLYAERWAGELLVDSILPKRLSIGEFPGFKAVDLSKAELDIVVSQELQSWRAALSSVAGVYLVSDTCSGRLYVGSATGEGGIWQRWCQYSATGHGGNVALRELVQEEIGERAKGFRFSILEIADTHASAEEVRQRETHWKKVLLTRGHGLNEN